MLLQKVKTSVVNKNCNPVWNDSLTLSLKDPNVPIVLVRFFLFSFFWDICIYVLDYLGRESNNDNLCL